jgi:hypothetical protein
MLVMPPTTASGQVSISSLRELRLVLNPVCPNEALESAKWTSNLCLFFERFPQLSNLSLEFEFRDSYGPDGGDPDFDYTHRELISRFSTFSSELFVPHLKTLRLSCVDCTSRELAIFLLRHNRTLRVIELDAIELVDELNGWPWLIEVVRDSMQVTYFSIQSCSARDPKARYGALPHELLEASDRGGLTYIRHRFSGKAIS